LALEATKEIALKPTKESHVVVSYHCKGISQQKNMIEAPCPFAKEVVYITT